MAIESILINAADVAQSADFYTRLVRAETVGQVTSDRAPLDLVTTTIELHHIPEPAASTWQPNDLYRGFRHIGFKVDAVDAAGLVAVVLDEREGGSFQSTTAIGVTQDGTTILADPDGSTFAPSRQSTQAVDRRAHGVG